MKAENNDMMLRELFRKKLGQAEIYPDASVKSNLMKKLAWHEFTHFIPGKFNIYYLAGIIAAAVTAAILVTSGQHESKRLPELKMTQPKNEIQAVQPNTVVKKLTNAKQEARTTKQVQPLIQSESGDAGSNTQNIEEVPATVSRDNIIIPAAGLNESISNTSLYSKPALHSKLQSRSNSEEIMLEASAVAGCVPLKIHFSNNSAGDSCRWTFGDGGSSSLKDPDWIFDVEGEYNVELRSFRSDGSSQTYSTFITVYPKPKARFEISPEKAVLPDDEIRFLNYSAEAVRYSWDFGDGSGSDVFEPVHKYDKFGIYNVMLTASSEHGCSDSQVIQNAFSGSEYYIRFPNAFIPNPDGPAGGYYSTKSDENAQIFHPEFSGVSDYQLKIFNKTGMLIFETNDISIGWDGYYKGQLCNRGVYVWKIRGNFRNGETFIKMGDVTLLQN